MQVDVIQGVQQALVVRGIAGKYYEFNNVENLILWLILCSPLISNILYFKEVALQRGYTGSYLVISYETPYLLLHFWVAYEILINFHTR